MASIDIEGFEELEQMVQSMTLSEANEKKAMKKALTPMLDEVISVTPVKFGNMKKQTKLTVKKEDFATVGIIKMGAFYTMFQEYGTSKSKSHVGFFERSVNKKTGEAIEILSRELLKWR